MARKPRDYAAEYQRRNQLAQQRGFKSYGQQRHYVEYTGTPVSYIGTVEPEDIAQIYERSAYDFDSYSWGEDAGLDAWIRRSKNRGISEEDAFLTYKRRARGGTLNHQQLRRLARSEFGLDWDQEWSTS